MSSLYLSRFCLLVLSYICYFRVFWRSVYEQLLNTTFLVNLVNDLLEIKASRAELTYGLQGISDCYDLCDILTLNALPLP